MLTLSDRKSARQRSVLLRPAEGVAQAADDELRAADHLI